jgi:hypothetical protein
VSTVSLTASFHEIAFAKPRRWLLLPFHRGFAHQGGAVPRHAAIPDASRTPFGDSAASGCVGHGRNALEKARDRPSLRHRPTDAGSSPPPRPGRTVGAFFWYLWRGFWLFRPWWSYWPESDVLWPCSARLHRPTHGFRPAPALEARPASMPPASPLTPDEEVDACTDRERGGGRGEV